MLRSKLALSVAAFSVLAAAGPAKAQEIAVFGPPTVSYQGQRTIVTNEASLSQTVYSKPGKNRTEMTMEGQTLIQIWRDDLQTMWSLSPQQGFAMEIPFGTDQAKSPLDGLDEQTAVLEKRFIGQETVNGVVTDHHFLRASVSGGGTTSGDVWTTPENITVRMRMTQVEPGQRAENISYDLNGLQRSFQADHLFEVPAGYQIMSMGTGGMPTGFGAVGGYAGDVAGDATNAAKDEVDRQVRGKAKSEAAKAVRKIFKW
ncbi:hypothetical protein [Hyphomonas johnsonii]|uniref:DUF4412 domain-containing protein n=1 Tax=Hyphomonas johnsonii MHS-2 TaxID=1280950 RepID=A0A059FUK3_9PROT|nr:hypothetical protein [Hyphomonas johnsonii]KCZ94108.1 hypothetical protein HJO_01995 [Hyphomonas johnsonii MHS-2]